MTSSVYTSRWYRALEFILIAVIVSLIFLVPYRADVASARWEVIDYAVRIFFYGYFFVIALASAHFTRARYVTHLVFGLTFVLVITSLIPRQELLFVVVPCMLLVISRHFQMRNKSMVVNRQ